LWQGLFQKGCSAGKLKHDPTDIDCIIPIPN
jgi:hypothetical protein